jgi:hypothetical protein
MAALTLTRPRTADSTSAGLRRPLSLISKRRLWLIARHNQKPVLSPPKEEGRRNRGQARVRPY